MAASCVRTAIFQAFLLRHSKRAVTLLPHVRTLRYDVNHQEPTIDKSKLFGTIEEDDIRRFKPIKAATNDQSTSVFYSPTLEKFINMVMKDGKKIVARKIVNEMVENIKMTQVEKYNRCENETEKMEIECNPEVIFNQALENIKPVLMLTPVIKGGVSYKVPVVCPEHRQKFLAMRWLVESCRDRERKMPMGRKLAYEIFDAYKNEGKCVRRKQELLRQCEENRAFAHFRY
ncbi:28S ribosomal protein S7, mitochondrial [Patella vulgata]|uniref:28S ribosomal protein S7, mitochondrial n=1 Tax=Patella vulgata TaxID=6465 RepID=UPI00217F5AB0|nr:28S ribosomal protein S7, mitochondrial [Patella vulgata]